MNGYPLCQHWSRKAEVMGGKRWRQFPNSIKLGVEVLNFTCSYKNSQHNSLFCAVIRIPTERCAVFSASTSYCHSTAPTWVWKWLCGRPAAVRSADTTDHFHKLVSGSPLTGNLNVRSSYCIFFWNWYLILKAWAKKKILLSWRRLLFKLHPVLLSDNIYSLFYVIPLYIR